MGPARHRHRLPSISFVQRQHRRGEAVEPGSQHRRARLLLQLAGVAILRYGHHRQRKRSGSSKQENDAAAQGLHAAPSSATLRGGERRMRKTVPPPGRSSTATSPSCASATSLTR